MSLGESDMKLHRIGAASLSWIRYMIIFCRRYCIRILLISSLFFLGGSMTYHNANFLTRIWSQITRRENSYGRGPFPKTEHIKSLKEFVIDSLFSSQTHAASKNLGFFERILRYVHHACADTMLKVQRKFFSFFPWAIIVSTLAFSVHFLESQGILHGMSLMLIVFLLLGSWFWAFLIGLSMFLLIRLRRWFPKIDTYVMNGFNIVFDERYRWWICATFCCVMLLCSSSTEPILSSADIEKILWAAMLCFSMWRSVTHMQNDSSLQNGEISISNR